MPTVLALMAHPDDIEMTCAGTLVLLRRAGWDVHMATMTPGDLGSSRLGPEEIATVRRAEAAASAALLDAPYTCLEYRDLMITCDADTKRRVSALLRTVGPDLLLTPHPRDYMEDHIQTGIVVREAAFVSTMPNWTASLGGREVPPCARIPATLYADPIGQVDQLGHRVGAGYAVDVTDVIEAKEQMLAVHESQRSWLREQHGEDEYLRWMRRCGRERARDFGATRVRYAEGFTQHRAHGFPGEDPLTPVLGRRRVKTIQPTT
jgi:LmbE family N-acetylglucosaminyl deacetylase